MPNLEYICDVIQIPNVNVCFHHHERVWVYVGFISCFLAGFWLLWTVLILFSCFCAYRHRRAKLRIQQQQRQREINLIAYNGACNYPSSMLDLSMFVYSTVYVEIKFENMLRTLRETGAFSSNKSSSRLHI